MSVHISLRRLGLCKYLSSFRNIFPDLFFTFWDFNIWTNIHKTANWPEIPAKSKDQVGFNLRADLPSLEISHLLDANYAKVKFICYFRQIPVFSIVLILNLGKYLPEKKAFSVIRRFTWLPYSYIAANTFFYYKNKENHYIHPLFVGKNINTVVCLLATIFSSKTFVW